MVPQVDEEQAAMIANAVAPSGKAHLMTDVAFAKLAALMGAVAVHAQIPLWKTTVDVQAARRTST